MAQTAQKLSPELLAGGPQDSRETLRDQLKAHLRWCTYLGASIDEESLLDLALLLRRTARTMHAFADQAEQQAEQQAE